MPGEEGGVMTATLDDVTPRKKRPEPSAEELAATELVRLAKEQGLSLTGPDGLLKQLTKTVLETALSHRLGRRLTPTTAPLRTRATTRGPVYRIGVRGVVRCAWAAER